MKALLLVLVFITQSVRAMPIVCSSQEKSGDISTLRVKIGPLMNINMNGGSWKLHRIGISPFNELRSIMYGSSTPNEERISMTIVKDGAVYGSVNAKSPSKNGIYVGQVRIGGVLRGRTMDVECIDEAIHGIQ